MRSSLVLLLMWAVHARGVEILWSQSNTRSPAVPLGGVLNALQAFIFVPAVPGVDMKVEFWLDKAVGSGKALRTEATPPYDFGGSGVSPNFYASPFNLVNLPAGAHFINVRVTYADGSPTATARADFIRPVFPVDDRIQIIYSLSKDRTNAKPLSDAAIPYESSIYIFIDGSATGDLAVQYFYDKTVGSPDRTDRATPFDFGGSDKFGLPIALNKKKYGASGIHSLTAYVQTASGAVERRTVLFTINDPLTAVPFKLMVSANADRTNAVLLNGATLQGGPSYVFTTPDAVNIVSVAFYLNQPATGTLYMSEATAPYDLKGTAANLNANPWSRADALPGNNYITCVITVTDGTKTTLVANFVAIGSESVTLTPPQLSAAMATGKSQTFQVSATASSMGTLNSVTGLPAWASLSPNPVVVPGTFSVVLNTQGLSVGTYSATVNFKSTVTSHTAVLSITLTVSNPTSLLFDIQPTAVTLIGKPNSGDTAAVVSVVGAPLQPNVLYTIAISIPWLRTSSGGNQFTAPNEFTVLANTNGLTEGSYQGTITFTAPNYVTFVLPVNMQLTAGGCDPVICNQIKVDIPYKLTFAQANGKAVVDKNGVGTGFTYILPYTPGAGTAVTAYKAANLEMKMAKGLLCIKTTKGVLQTTSNNQDNGISVGFAAPNQIAIITAKLNEPFTATTRGFFEQAGVWFGIDQNNYVKVVWMSYKVDGQVTYALQFFAEVAGVVKVDFKEEVINQPVVGYQLRIVVDPYERKIYGQYSGGQNNFFSALSSISNVPSEFFSFDAAGIDPVIGTRSFAGLLASHANGVQTEFCFSSFNLEAGERPVPPLAFTFSKKTRALNKPTNMVFGPDGKLYVTELYGNVHTLTYDSNLNVVEHKISTTIPDFFGPRLTLGIAIDPSSKPGNVILWVSHSSPDMRAGGLNSGIVTKLSGSESGFKTMSNPITGLPRAEANHGPNSMHFIGNRLWMSIGGNTGAGGILKEPTEFGTREEQWLTAAIVYLDPFEPGFDGHCYDEGQDPWGKDPGCDVHIWATGLRNCYDFVFHSNGHLYAPDNGLGSFNSGAFPRVPTPPCFGFADIRPYYEGGTNPLEQTDLLYNVKQGKYYGHGNPSRGECVFKDGSYQGVAPLPNYDPPIADLGMHASADGIMEYTGNGGCGLLKGDLLLVRYSLGDDIRRVELSADGLHATKITTIAVGFTDPLMIRQNANGDLFVAEHGGNKITSLRFSTNCPTPSPA